MEILFVDDDEEEAYKFKEVIGHFGEHYQVSHIRYCTEVLWLLKWRKPDMVFLRVEADTKVGIYFLQSIRSLKELGGLPVIMYSTALNDSYVDRCYKAKANYYIQKQEAVTEIVKSFSSFISTDMKAQQRIPKTAFVV